MIHYTVLLNTKPPEMSDFDDILSDTTQDFPYDATRAGPMCDQGELSPKLFETLNNVVINDVMEQLLEVRYFGISTCQLA